MWKVKFYVKCEHKTDTVVIPLDTFIYYQIPGGNPEK
jgi:hypothetical protein